MTGSLVAVLLAGICMTSTHATPAFPGADGAGSNATGGRGGIVYHVTRLDRNYSDNGPGTLRYGLEDKNFGGQPRTIVFDVGGVFWLGRYGPEKGHNNGWDTQSRLNVGSNVTIAGQTAPGGVWIMGGVVKVGGNNVIIRNLTIAPGYGMRGFERPDETLPELPRPGDFPDSYVYDAIDISGQRILVSHVTALYSTDEAISANEQARDVTIQYCNASQGQNYPQLDAEGSGYTGHALAFLLQAGSDGRISLIRNLCAHQKGRLPRVGSEEGSGALNHFRNNVFYNWFDIAGTGGSGQPSFNDFICNLYIAGPGGDDVSGPRIVSRAGGTGIFDGKGGSWTRCFVLGNLKDTNKDGDPWDLTEADSGFVNIARQATPHDTGIGVTLDAQAAFRHVLAYAGARWWQRDYDPNLGNTEAIDTPDERIIHEVITGTGRIMAWADDPFDDDPNEGQEWRRLLALRADPVTGQAPYTRPTGWDTDRDGMPDHWEIEYGLPPDTPNNNADFDSDGYTDLEEYLDEITAWPAPGPVIFIGGNGRYAQIENWQVRGTSIPVAGRFRTQTWSNWQPSRFDSVVIDGQTAIVDAVGQHAGDIIIDNGGILRITDGWLRVTGSIQVGQEGPAVLWLAGGQLWVGRIMVGPNGQFIHTGGQVTCEIVTCDKAGRGEM